jgi:hypothetical protein
MYKETEMIREQIVNPEAYPANVLEKLQAARNLSVSIANRWMLGWPDRVNELILAEKFLEALGTQTETELDSLVKAGQDGLNLAPWEINQLAGNDPAPPAL